MDNFDNTDDLAHSQHELLQAYDRHLQSQITQHRQSQAMQALTANTAHSTDERQGTTMASTAQKKEYISITLALYGYGIATYSPGDGYTRYKITENTDVDYFETYGIFTGSLYDVYIYCQALRYTYNHRATIEYTDLYAYKAQSCAYHADTNKIVLLTDTQYYERLPTMLDAAVKYAYYAWHTFIDYKDITAQCLYSDGKGSVYHCNAYSDKYGDFEITVYITQYAYRPQIAQAQHSTDV